MVDHSQSDRCWAQIDLAAFERNVKRIQTVLPDGVSYVAVVKADAYGHGMPHMVRRLMQSGVDCFAVANVAEAAEIRHMGAGWPILVLSPILPTEINHLLTYDLIATISSEEEAMRLNRLGLENHQRIRVHLKIDTGMGRLGVWHIDAPKLIDLILSLPGISLEGIFTHFSSADTDPQYTRMQREHLCAALERVDTSGLMVHADNSSSVDSFEESSPFTAVRIGLLQFGVPPYPESALASAAVEPVFSFYARVGLIKELPAGTYISYGRTYQLERDTRIGILTAGYGDGIPIQLSNRGYVLLNGFACPILGRVTMDQTIVDLSDAGAVEVGDPATLIGKSSNASISVSEFSRTAETIPWEALCSITKRVPRVYTGSRET